MLTGIAYPASGLTLRAPVTAVESRWDVPDHGRPKSQQSGDVPGRAHDVTHDSETSGTLVARLVAKSPSNIE